MPVRQALVDRNSFVAASALVSGIHLMSVNGEVVRRWVNEVRGAVLDPEEDCVYCLPYDAHKVRVGSIHTCVKFDGSSMNFQSVDRQI